MPQRIRAEVSLFFYPQTAIPKRVAPAFVVADILGDRMNLNSGDTESLNLEVNPTITDQWHAQGAVYDGFYNVNNLNFVRFLADGRVREGSSQDNRSDGGEDLAGWIIQGREALLDSKTANNPIEVALNLLFDTANTDLNWVKIQGTWRTVRPPEAPHRCCILNTGDDLTAKVRTVGNIPANRWIRFDVFALGLNPDGPQSAVRVAIGNKYSVRLAHKQKAEVHEKINGTWVRIRTLDNGPLISLHGGHYVIRFRRIAGRLVIGINEHTFHFIQTSRAGAVTGAVNRRPVPVDDSWPAAPLAVSTYNCRARIGAGVIKNSAPNGTPFVGTFGRHVKRRVPLVLPPGTTLTGHCATWTKDGTSGSVAVTQVPDGVDYMVTMTANADGIDTPFINKVMIRTISDWTDPDVDGIEVGTALLPGNTISTAMPPLMPGADASFELSRVLLNQINPAWETYINDDCPVWFRARWLLDNGLYEDAGDNDGWKGLFKGYVWQTNKITAGMNQNRITVNCKDSIIREQKPAALIDHKYPPLDILLFEAAANGTGGTTQTTPPRIYGGDCVKEILTIEHGPDFADTLNGNGNAQRFFPADHYALLDNETGGYYPVTQALTGQLRAPTSNRFFIAPPILQDALYWINQIAQDDDAIYFYGWIPGEGDNWPLPIYGKRENILDAIAGSTVIELHDVIPQGDPGTFIQSATNETRPWLQYNRILVYGRIPPGGMEAITPALRMADGKVPATYTRNGVTHNNPHSADKSWQKTMVIRENIADLYGAAERLRDQILDDLNGVLLEWPTLTVDGDASLQWGKIVRPIMEADGSDCNYSDSTLGLNGVELRVEKVEHSFDGLGRWTTKIYPRPLTNSERTALGL